MPGRMTRWLSRLPLRRNVKSQALYSDEPGRFESQLPILPSVPGVSLLTVENCLSEGVSLSTYFCSCRISASTFAAAPLSADELPCAAAPVCAPARAAPRHATPKQSTIPATLRSKFLRTLLPTEMSSIAADSTTSCPSSRRRFPFSSTAIAPRQRFGGAGRPPEGGW